MDKPAPCEHQHRPGWRRCDRCRIQILPRPETPEYTKPATYAEIMAAAPEKQRAVPLSERLRLMLSEIEDLERSR